MGPRTVSEDILVPEEMIGLIIGRGGGQIRWLRSESGCSIQITSEEDWCGNPEHNQGRVLVLTGTAQEVSRAKELINRCLQHKGVSICKRDCFYQDMGVAQENNSTGQENNIEGQENNNGGQENNIGSQSSSSSQEKLQKEFDELKVKFEKLCDTLKCRVCWEMIQKDNIICVNGHSMCRKCKGRQVICPACRGHFSKVKQNVLVNQMEKLQKEFDELKVKFEKLCDTLKCPVCWETIQKDNVICINGHSMCRKCKERQVICPACRGHFSKVKQNVLVNQVLEVLSCDCKYENCSYKVKPGEDHEIFCSFRPTECRVGDCKWEGPVNELTFHINDKHNMELIAENARVLSNFNFSESFLSVDLFSVSENYLWTIARNVVKTGLFTVTYIPVLKSSSCSNISVQHRFESLKTNSNPNLSLKFKVTKRVTMDETVDWSKDNVFSIPVPTMFNEWIKEKLELGYSVNITPDEDTVANEDTNVMAPEPSVGLAYIW